jgi:hypothetical protein
MDFFSVSWERMTRFPGQAAEQAGFSLDRGQLPEE